MHQLVGAIGDGFAGTTDAVADGLRDGLQPVSRALRIWMKPSLKMLGPGIFRGNAGPGRYTVTSTLRPKRCFLAPSALLFGSLPKNPKNVVWRNTGPAVTTPE